MTCCYISNRFSIAFLLNSTYIDAINVFFGELLNILLISKCISHQSALKRSKKPQSVGAMLHEYSRERYQQFPKIISYIVLSCVVVKNKKQFQY